MKTTNLYLAVAAFASFALTACTSEELINDVGGSASKREPAAMSFDMHQRNLTRADGDSLPLNFELDNFGVWAIEYNGASVKDSLMKNYKVIYSDSHDPKWHYFDTNNKGLTGQTEKYWDYTTDSTVFYAYAPHNTSATIGNNSISATITSSTNTSSIFMAAKTKVVPNDYGKDVDLRFSRQTAKVRIAFYETIGNYAVKIDSVAEGTKKGVIAAAATTEDGETVSGKITTAATITYNFNAISDNASWNYAAADYKNDTISFKVPKSTTSADTISQGNSPASLSETNYYCVPANNADGYKNDSLLFKFKIKLCDKETGEVYTGTGCEQEVSVMVPNTKTAWASNTLYTYVFKITEAAAPATEPKPIVFGNITVGKYDGENTVTAEYTIPVNVSAVSTP